MTTTSTIQATEEPKRFPFDPTKPDHDFYIIDTAGGSYRWVWFERPGVRGPASEDWLDKRSSALRAAANDWDWAGDDGDLAQRLREEAAREEERERIAAQTIIPTEVLIVPRDGRPVIDLDQNRVFGERFARHLCDVWAWQYDDPEAQDLGQRTASALSHAVAGTRTSAESLMSAILYVPYGHAPNEVYDKTVKDIRAAILAADPTASDEILAVLDRDNPYPTQDRS